MSHTLKLLIGLLALLALPPLSACNTAAAWAKTCRRSVEP
jgi:predicted small secreted protein